MELKETLVAKAAAATSAAPAVTPGEDGGLDDIVNKAAGLDEEGAAAEASKQTASEEGEETAAVEGEETGSGKEADPEEDPEQWDGVPAKVQEKIQKRINKITAKAKQAEEELAKAKAQMEEAAQAENMPSQPVLDIRPEYLNKEEAETITKYQQLTQAESWLLDNLDGYEGSGTPEDPSWEAKAVRQRYAQVQQEKTKLSTKAEQLITERRTLMQQDLAEGRKARLEREKLKASGKPSGQKPPAGAIVTPKTQVKKTPLTPTAKAGFNQQALMEEGPTPEGLQAAFERALKD